MGATPAQIASARALAQSRGYDPNLVDADNADRANTAFPIKSSSGSQHSPVAPAAQQKTADAKIPGLTDPRTTGSNLDQPIGTAIPSNPAATPGGGGGTALDTSAAPSSPAAPDSGSSPLNGLMAAGGASSVAAAAAPSLGSGLRAGLGNRMYPQDSYVLAGLKRAY